MILEEGDVVRIISGDMAGNDAHIDSWDEMTGRYVVLVDGMPFGKTAEELLPIVEIVDEEDVTPSFGMTSEQVATFVEEYARRCGERVRGVGNDQYSEGQYQKFETMSPIELFTMLQEELEDLVPYIVFIHIVTQRMVKAMKESAIE